MPPDSAGRSRANVAAAKFVDTLWRHRAGTAAWTSASLLPWLLGKILDRVWGVTEDRIDGWINDLIDRTQLPEDVQDVLGRCVVTMISDPLYFAPAIPLGFIAFVLWRESGREHAALPTQATVSTDGSIALRRKTLRDWWLGTSPVRLSSAAVDILDAMTERGEAMIHDHFIVGFPAVGISNAFWPPLRLSSDYAGWFASTTDELVRTRYLEAIDELLAAKLLRDDTSERWKSRHFFLTTAGWALLRERATREIERTEAAHGALDRSQRHLLRAITFSQKLVRPGVTQRWLFLHTGGKIELPESEAKKYQPVRIDGIAKTHAVSMEGVQLQADALTALIKTVPDAYLEKVMWGMVITGPNQSTSGPLILLTDLGRRYLRNCAIAAKGGSDA